MAKRYSGELTINVVYDDKNHYRTSVSQGGKHVWSGVVNPAPAGFGPGVAYDSPKAYDEIASSALAFADHDVGGIGDDAEFNEEMTGYLIRRSPRSPRVRTTAHSTKKKSPAQLQREINEALSKPSVLRRAHSTKKHPDDVSVGDEVYAISGGRRHGPGLVEEIYDDGTMRVDFTRQFAGRLRVRPQDLINVPSK